MFDDLENGWFLGIDKMPSLNKTKGLLSPSIVVIHNIQLPPRHFGGNDIVLFFTKGVLAKKHIFYKEIKDLKVSSHFLIKRYGQITQFVSCYDKAWHAGISSYKGVSGCNNFSIGVELEGADDIPYTSFQYDSLNTLLLSLYKHFPIKDVVGHCDIAPERKTDPGASFKWSNVKMPKV